MRIKKPGDGEFIPLVSDQTLDRTSGHKPNLKQPENPGWLHRIRKESPTGPDTAARAASLLLCFPELLSAGEGGQPRNTRPCPPGLDL